MLSQDVKIGSAIRMDGKIYFCIDFQHVKPGKGNTIMRIKLKDVLSGNVLEKRFDIGVKLEDVRVEHRPYQYLYKEGEDFIFMHNIVDVVVDASTETILYAEMPVKTVLKVTYTEPGEKGNTATNALKEATVETGAMVRVPLFINTDDMIRVDTRTGEYCERVKA